MSGENRVVHALRTPKETDWNMRAFDPEPGSSEGKNPSIVQQVGYSADRAAAGDAHPTSSFPNKRKSRALGQPADRGRAVSVGGLPNPGRSAIRGIIRRWRGDLTNVKNREYRLSQLHPFRVMTENGEERNSLGSSPTHPRLIPSLLLAVYYRKRSVDRFKSRLILSNPGGWNHKETDLNRERTELT